MDVFTIFIQKGDKDLVLEIKEVQSDPKQVEKDMKVAAWGAYKKHCIRQVQEEGCKANGSRYIKKALC